MIIGTAGHIDHGKSALVAALTGRSMDRLAEERRRGITIDLNFAPLELPGFAPVGVIDVPGHEDLVRTMVAGASGIDLVLLVVDLVEGPRPQTEEHLAIVEQLRIPRGIPVFTKADLAEPAWTELVVAETTERLRRSPVRFEAPAIVSALTGQGIAELRSRIEAIARAEADRPVDDWFRMPIDRAFSVAGVGTVVTGTTWGGSVTIGAPVRILPGTHEGRVRSIEAYGRPVESARPAVRTAIGITGVERGDAGRGQVLVTGAWAISTALDALIELVPGAPPLKPRSRVRVHLGTAETLARVVLLAPFEPGRPSPVRLVLEGPTVARGSDRLVLRSYSPVMTIGGGEVIDPLPPRRSRWSEELRSSDPGVRLAALAARRPHGVDRETARQLLGATARQVAAAATDLETVGSLLIPRARLAELGARLVEMIRAHHREHPADPGLSLETARQRLRAPVEIADRVIAQLGRAGALRNRDGIVAAADFTPTIEGGAEGVARVVDFITRAGLAAPTVEEIAAGVGFAAVGALIRQAVAAGSVLAVDRERYAAAAALEELTRALQEIGRDGPITPAAVRDRLGLTRKHLIPLLEWADRRGVTRRVGDARILVQTGR